jgi:hypothetical protein
VALALHTAWPTTASHVAPPTALSPEAVLASLADNLADPSRTYRVVLYPLGWWGGPVIVLAIVGLACWWPLLVATVAAVLGLAVISDLVLESSFRHQGLLIVWLLASYWILLARDPVPARGSRTKERCLGASLYVGLPILLLLLTRHGLAMVKGDVQREMSASASFARFLENRTEYRDAILMGEPDYYLEAMPYYRDNRIFRPRAGRFGSVARFTTDSIENLSLGELLASAERVAAAERAPVLIAIGYDEVRQRDAGKAPWGYRGRFTWTPEERAAFEARTTLVADFNDMPAEDFGVYALETGAEPKP